MAIIKHSGGKTVVVLGGGIGGITAARALRKRLAAKHRVVVIDRARDLLFQPSLLWLNIGKRQAKAIQRPRSRLERRGIEVRYGEVEKIDAAARQVTVGGETIDADYLVVSLGVDLVPEAIPGLQEGGHNFYTLAGAEGLRDALPTMKRGRIAFLTAAPAYKCPAAPYEAALLVDYYLRKAKVRDDVTIDFYAAEPTPLFVAGPHWGDAVRKMYAMRNITLHSSHQIKSVDAATKRLDFADGTSAEYDLLAYVPLHRPSLAVRESALASDNGWIIVDRNTLETKFPGVYAIGDVTRIMLTLGKQLPMAGSFAAGQAEVVAKNISSLINSKDPKARFTGYGACFFEIGYGMAGFGSGDFFGEPLPKVKLNMPGFRWHLGKVVLEKLFLSKL